MTRLFNSWFKSKASLKWLKQVGTWDSITHHQNYLKEYAFFNAQKRDYEDFKWKFLEEGKDIDDENSDSSSDVYMSTAELALRVFFSEWSETKVVVTAEDVG